MNHKQSIHQNNQLEIILQDEIHGKKACRTVFFDAGAGVMVPIKVCEKLTDYCQHYVEKTRKKYQGQKRVPKFNFQFALCRYLTEYAVKPAKKEDIRTLDPVRM